MKPDCLVLSLIYIALKFKTFQEADRLIKVESVDKHNHSLSGITILEIGNKNQYLNQNYKHLDHHTWADVHMTKAQ